MHSKNINKINKVCSFHLKWSFGACDIETTAHHQTYKGNFFTSSKCAKTESFKRAQVVWGNSPRQNVRFHDDERGGVAGAGHVHCGGKGTGGREQEADGNHTKRYSQR